MIENNRNQNQSSDNQNREDQDQNQNQSNQQQNTSTDQIGKGANPQDGDQWNNYRSRELSDQGSGAGNASMPKQNS